jgi:diadenosine tetraphosphate (Ap4A) HIT family hydrolase
MSDKTFDPNCFGCKYSQHPPYPLLETEFWKLYLSEDQAYVGRSYLTLKAHKSSLSKLTDGEWTEYKNIVREVEPVLKRVFSAELLNWSLLANNAYVEGSTPHVHFHIRPRHSQPYKVAGIEFIDERFGYHYDDNLRHKLDKEILDEIADSIRRSLNMR